MPDEPAALPARVSWIGNSLPGGRGWIQMDVAALCVADDDAIYTNAPWEEGGGNAGLYRDGRWVAYAFHTHGWGAKGGIAVAVNRRYVFLGGRMENSNGALSDTTTWPPKGSAWIGVSRRQRADFKKAAPFPGGKGGAGDTLKEAFRVVAELEEKGREQVAGLVADEATLWICDGAGKRIVVCDAESMAVRTSWPIDRPGPLALDKNGVLWLLEPGRLVRFRGDGTPAGEPLALPKECVPTALALDPDGAPWVADDGPGQRLLRLDPKTGRVVGAFGERGGVFAGERGRIGAGRLLHPRAFGFDRAGNVIVAHGAPESGTGCRLESYAPGGRPRWQLDGLTFVDGADVDPGDDTQVFTRDKRFDLEGRYLATTLDPFRYPDDPRRHVRTATAWVRRIEGKRLLFVTDMTDERLSIFRFDGQIAAPAGMIVRRHTGGWPARAPEGAWIERDGQYERLEGAAPAAQGWWADLRGDLWLATETSGVWQLPCAGLDAKGNPIYRWRERRVLPPSTELTQTRRVRYDTTSDALYLAGTSGEHRNQHWKPMGPVLARYDRAASGKPSLRWKVVLPYAPGSSGHVSSEPCAFDVAGEYLFVAYTHQPQDPLGHPSGYVLVLRAADGTSVGHFRPPPEVGEIGLQDLNESVRAWRRRDGEYLVFVEDDYHAKLLLYRWRG